VLFKNELSPSQRSFRFLSVNFIEQLVNCLNRKAHQSASLDTVYLVHNLTMTLVRLLNVNSHRLSLEKQHLVEFALSLYLYLSLSLSLTRLRHRSKRQYFSSTSSCFHYGDHLSSECFALSGSSNALSKLTFERTLRSVLSRYTDFEEQRSKSRCRPKSVGHLLAKTTGDKRDFGSTLSFVFERKAHP
jgi:hypothetical protein